METRAVVALMHEYARRLDAGEFEAFAELFRHGRWQGIEGYDATLRWLREHVRLFDGSPRTAHLVGGVQVDVVSPTRAAARSHIQVLHQSGAGGRIDTICVNRYSDVFERTAEGWRFSVRDIEPVLRSDMSGHLLPAAGRR